MARQPNTRASASRPSLADDIAATGPLRTKSKKRKSWDRGDGEEGDNNAAGDYVDAKASRKILRIGRELADEEEEETKKSKPSTAFTVESRLDIPAEDEDNEYDGKWDNEEEWEDDSDEHEAEEIDPTDLNLFNKFLPQDMEEPTLDLHAQEEKNKGNGVNLADLILEQIAAHESMQAGQQPRDSTAAGEDGVGMEEDPEMIAKVNKAYSTIGGILSRYRSGPLPKPLKILPTVPEWEPLLEITRPDEWTPNACYAVTRIFISQHTEIAQRFLELVILDTVRADIAETKKLSVHLFKALQKATFRPSAFAKGFLFPLVRNGCTLREAHIVSGVLTRSSIPVLHAAAMLLGLTDIAAEQASQSTEVGGATNVLIKALLDKAYALPWKVIDNLVFHFLRFRATLTEMGNDNDMAGISGPGFRTSKLPVLWHQSLLAFAQRYRNDITEDQREALLDLLLVKGHKDIGPEVRRELLQGRGRGIPVPEEKINGGDDTLMVVDPV